jgi:hypothetical protein
MSNNPSCLRAKPTRTKAVLALITTSILFWYFLDAFLAEREEIVNYRNVLNMAVDGNEFWSAREREQGLSKSTRDKDLIIEDNHIEKRICKSFFVLWPGDCVESHEYLDERMRTLSAQMSVMNATLNFFTTDLKECSWDKYTGINIRVFNATEELLLQGFAEVLPYIDKWDKTRYTRLSDILRLCLAHRYEMSYLDSDVHFLQLQKGWYERAYVGAQLWSDNKNAIEITNAAFCLPHNILEDMMGYQKSIIIRKKDGKSLKYFYTELGPSMFHHVSNAYRILLPPAIYILLVLVLYRYHHHSFVKGASS